MPKREQNTIFNASYKQKHPLGMLPDKGQLRNYYHAYFLFSGIHFEFSNMHFAKTNFSKTQ
jgi:hypothetical protein